MEPPNGADGGGGNGGGRGQRGRGRAREWDHGYNRQRGGGGGRGQGHGGGRRRGHGRGGPGQAQNRDRLHPADYTQPPAEEGGAGPPDQPVNRGQGGQRRHRHGYEHQGQGRRGNRDRRPGPGHRQQQHYWDSGGCNQGEEEDTPDNGYGLEIGVLADLVRNSDSQAVIQLLQEKKDDWQALLSLKKTSNDKDIDRDVFVIHVLGEKVCDSNSEAIAGQLVSLALTNTFADRIQRVCKSLRPAENQEAVTKVLQNLETFFNFALERNQSRAPEFLRTLLPAALKYMQGYKVELSKKSESERTDTNLLSDVLEEYQEKFQEMHELVQECLGEKSHRDEDIAVVGSGSNVEAGGTIPSGLKETAAEAEAKRRAAEKEARLQERLSRFYFTEREEEIMHQTEPPTDFRDIPIIPTIQEILDPEESEFLRPNRRRGAYRSADHYLDIQFRLFREDFIRPLKKGVQEFLASKHDFLSRRKRLPLGTIRLYQRVRLLKANLVRDTMVYTVQLEPELKTRVKWDRSRRLLTGNLLIFTPTTDCFRTLAYFAVVMRRDEEELKNKAQLGIAWQGNAKPEFGQRNEELLMFESECFFEAYRHTLQVLKDVPLANFPMAKYIVSSSPTVEPPKYLVDSGEMLLIDGHYVSPFMAGQWPSAGDLELDDSQYSAFRAALTKEFAIVQGPPGTGKTFLGLRVVRALLQNTNQWWHGGGGPILVVCLTNHALDQFMEGILHLLRELEPGNPDPGLVRVGGRSKSKELEEFSLARRRATAAKLHQQDRFQRQAKNRAWRMVKTHESERSDLQTEYIELDMKRLQGVLDFRSLRVYWELCEENGLQTEMDWTQNPAYFGLTDFDFDVPPNRFDPEQMLRKWFRFRRNAPAPAAARPQPPRRGILVDAEEDEDYDVNELQANRVFDDLYYELDTDKKNNTQQSSFTLKYVEDASVQELETFRRREDIIPARKHAAENKAKFLRCLFEHLTEDRLKLPQPMTQMPPRNPADAWVRYLRLVEVVRQKLGRLLVQKESDLIEAQKELQRIQRQGDATLLQQVKVVGMTTTAASKAGDMFQITRSKIVIVEEAAEVLEAHIINCITEHCEHLIMIGDHQQLRPNISVHQLATKYHLNISLFERMVNNQLNCYQLAVQHRMRPEISDLIRGTIYKQLIDHSSVQKFPSVRGLVKNLFFIKHTQLESADSDSMTKTNTYEAKYLAGLCQYLLLQGYQPSEITILATYLGQTFEIKKELRQLQTGGPSGGAGSVRVVAVDNFQGEENKIILLSMVRSNLDNNIGFLKADNRICVALSRAKHGLYIVGNMDALALTSTTWGRIRDKLRQRGEIGDWLELRCQVHGNVNTIKEPRDFGQYPEGGCELNCGEPLDCGHVCKSLCHQHKDAVAKGQVKCLQPCARHCPAGHLCPGKCWSSCKACAVKILKVLPCGHSTQVKCSTPVKEVKCQEPVTKRLVPCGHSSLKPVPCCTDASSVQCDTIVDHFLPCGHQVKDMDITCAEARKTSRWAGVHCDVKVNRTLPCGHAKIMECSHDPRSVTCEEKVRKRFADCRHDVEISCHRSKKELIKCQLPCTVRLSCGHQCRKICHVSEDPNHYMYQCERSCTRSCASGGGHPCSTQHKCYEKCPPCFEMVSKRQSCGTHTVEVPCNTDLSRGTCTEACARKLGCGHPCKNKCYENCGPCNVKVSKTTPGCGHEQNVSCKDPALAQNCDTLVKAYAKGTCGHFSVVPCRLLKIVSRDESRNYCREPCRHVFTHGTDRGCGHRCKGTCSECLQGLIHKKCGEKCGKTLVCGHTCSVPCAEFCPPCGQRCSLRCDHSECTRKCGEPCTDCAELCTWRCEHKRCTKLCRELCDREPCDEPCRKKLKCGHSCVGLCGEVCPPLCRFCNPTELTEFILYGNEEDDDARFVYLPDCGHCIEVEGLNYYMKHDVEEGAIVAKSCPRCKTLIRHSKRYGNIIKKRLEDIIVIKARSFGNPAQFQVEQSKLIAELHEGSKAAKWTTYLPQFQTWLLENLATIVPATSVLGIRFGKDRVIPKTIDQHSFQSIQLLVKHGSEAVRVLEEASMPSIHLRGGLAQPRRITLHAAYTKLFNHLSLRSLPLSRPEIQDFDREFARLFDLNQLYKRESHPNFLQQHYRAQVGRTYADAELIVGPESRILYTSDKQEIVRAHLRTLDNLLRSGLGISDREKHEIISAVGMKQGHWFKCPNGHIYLITECGGAMVQSRCNECGAAIGGGSHRLRTDNDIATEMDGATRPAWPTNLNR